MCDKDQEIQKVQNLDLEGQRNENIDRLKLIISDTIKEQMTAQKVSFRDLADHIGMKHPQIIRVTSLKNYNIDTLIKILDGLNLELTITEKKEKL